MLCRTMHYLWSYTSIFLSASWSRADILSCSSSVPIMRLRRRNQDGLAVLEAPVGHHLLPYLGLQIVFSGCLSLMSRIAYLYPLHDARQNRYHVQVQAVVSVPNEPVSPLPSSLRRVSPTIAHLFRTRARQDCPAPALVLTRNRLNPVLGCGATVDEPLSGKASVSVYL